MKLLLAAASAAAALALAAAAGAAHAAVLYNNGPNDGWPTGYAIGTLGGKPYKVTDSFTLTRTSTITGVEFGLWLNPGNRAVSVDWGISTSPTFVDQGTAALSTTFVEDVDTWETDEADFSLPGGGITLPAGTYWLTLQNLDVTRDGVFVPGGVKGWAGSGGPSAAYGIGGKFRESQSFSILGSAVPEPGAWAMMILGLAMIGFAARRRSPGTASAIAAA